MKAYTPHLTKEEENSIGCEVEIDAPSAVITNDVHNNIKYYRHLCLLQ